MHPAAPRKGGLGWIGTKKEKHPHKTNRNTHSGRRGHRRGEYYGMGAGRRQGGTHAKISETAAHRSSRKTNTVGAKPKKRHRVLPPHPFLCFPIKMCGSKKKTETTTGAWGEIFPPRVYALQRAALAPPRSRRGIVARLAAPLSVVSGWSWRCVWGGWFVDAGLAMRTPCRRPHAHIVRIHSFPDASVMARCVSSMKSPSVFALGPSER